jgi:alpha 1,3-glucosidase
MFGDETMERLRRAAMERYALLPYWYTVFEHAEVTGMPVMRMMWMQYPTTEAFFKVDDQYLIGSDLLVKPVTEAGVEETEVLFPTDHIWYDALTLKAVSTETSPASTKAITFSAPIDKIPVFQRGGSIIPRKLRLRRSTMLMKTDPYTLYVALDESGKAFGTLYMDDEETFDNQSRFEYANATFTADFSELPFTLSNAVTIGSGWADQADNLMSDRMIERIVIVGASTPKSITCNQHNLEFSVSDSILTVRKPELPALAEWTIHFEI